MNKLNARLERLEQGGGRYATLGEIMDDMDARSRGEPSPPLKNADPRLSAALGD